jgi:hypothetical protein
LSKTVTTTVCIDRDWFDLFLISSLRTANGRPGKLPGPFNLSLEKSIFTILRATPSGYLTVRSTDAGLADVVGVSGPPLRLTFGKG